MREIALAFRSQTLEIETCSRGPFPLPPERPDNYATAVKFKIT